MISLTEAKRRGMKFVPLYGREPPPWSNESHRITGYRMMRQDSTSPGPAKRTKREALEAWIEQYGGDPCEVRSVSIDPDKQELLNRIEDILSRPPLVGTDPEVYVAFRKTREWLITGKS